MMFFQSFAATLAVFFVSPLNSGSSEPLNGTLLPQGCSAPWALPSANFIAVFPKTLIRRWGYLW